MMISENLVSLTGQRNFSLAERALAPVFRPRTAANAVRLRRLRIQLVFCCLAFAWCGQSASQAATIDEILATAHRSAGIVSSNKCDDATYLRRLALDLVGRVPTTDELTSFLADPDREAAVDRFLQSDEHPEFWSQLWTTMLIGRGERRGIEREVLRAWMQEQIGQQTALDKVAFQLISAEGVTSLDGPVNYAVAARADPVMRLSRTFLSVQLDCAQCHDHPYDRWTNDDYEAMQRFFQPVRFREVSGGIAVSDGLGNGNENVPVFLTGRRPQTGAWRRELALMVVQSKPFSRSMVNRTWSWLVGQGIVDPVDGLSRENPAAVPELLESLATDFRASRYDLRALIRRICLSQAYQTEPVAGASTEDDLQRRLFAARSVRPMTPEQWIRSLSLVLDRQKPTPAQLAQQANQLLGSTGQLSPGTDPFQWTSTSQTLVRQLSGSIPAPLRSLDSLFLATLARAPTQDERELLSGHSSQEALFALVHSNEFIMND